MEQSEKVAFYSVCFNIALVIFKYLLVQLSGSLAIVADTVHSVTDVVASLAIFMGIKVSKRRSYRFPYGLYKVENLVSLGISLLIVWAGIEIIKMSFQKKYEVNIAQLPLVFLGMCLIIASTFFFSKYEHKMGKKLNSPSLISDAQHIKTDMFSTIAIVLGLSTVYIGIQLDRIVAFFISLLIIKAGIDIFIESIKVLLEASLDFATLDKVRNIVLSHSAVDKIKAIWARSSGRYKFIELIITLKVSDFKKAHNISEQIEKKYKRKNSRCRSYSHPLWAIGERICYMYYSISRG